MDENEGGKRILKIEVGLHLKEAIHFFKFPFSIV